MSIAQIWSWLKGGDGVSRVIALAALFISLGGISYAAVRLPRDSVGAAQIRNSAVRPRALSMPVAQSSVSKDDLGSVVWTGFCVAVNGIAPPCTPAGPPQPLVDRVKVKKRGLLRVSAVVGLEGIGHPRFPEEAAKGGAWVSLQAFVDGNPLSRPRFVTVKANQNLQVPYEATIPVRRGKAEVSLQFRGSTSADYVNVDVDSATLTSTALASMKSKPHR